MLAKTWKKIGLIILIIACLVNLGFKLSHVISFSGTIDSIKSKIQQEETVKTNK